MLFQTRAYRVLAVLFVALLIGSSTSNVSAHQDGNPSPNGASPWHYSESWRLTNWYGEGLHQDYYNGSHYNEHYALDFGLPCWSRLYPLWDNMRVSRVDNHVIEMTKTIDGKQYRLRYMHLNQINVGVGAIVHTTTVIGYSGDKGQATGCHLHMAVHRLGSDGWYYSIPPMFCGRTYPQDYATSWRGC